jgi:hypothetical protein
MQANANEGFWIAEAMELCQRRAPGLSDGHALDLADDLYRAWPDDEPAEAVAKFFFVMPNGWKGSTLPALTLIEPRQLPTVRQPVET